MSSDFNHCDATLANYQDPRMVLVDKWPREDRWTRRSTNHRPRLSPTRQERQAGGPRRRKNPADGCSLITPNSGDILLAAGRTVLSLLALGLLVAVPYLPAMLWGGFVWDDNTYVKVDPVRDVSGLWKIWFSPSAIWEEEGHYWPITYTTFWVEHKLWGFAPAGYHIVNVLLHSGQYAAFVASPAAVGGTRCVGDSRSVCRASFARGVCCLDL